ncbi:MAG: site-specific integrase [Acidimicrobiia bacterium]|nr:site-specific integrase [Acidimicrobiia bacterium]
MQGHIRKRVHTTKDGRQTVNWYVVIELPRGEDGKRRQKWNGGYKTRREAERVRAKLVTELASGSYVEPSQTTFGDWVADQWLPLTKTRVKPTTYDSYERNLRLHVLPSLGSLRLRQVTPSTLNRLYSDLLANGHKTREGGLSAKTVRYIHTIVHRALADAVDTGLLAANVASRAKPPRVQSAAPAVIRFWEPHELRQFLDSVRGHRLEAAWHLAAMTGMRRGEVLGLRWKDVDLDAATLSVTHAIVSVAYEMITSTPKSHRARVVNLDPATVEQLRGHRARQMDERDEWGSEYRDQGLVFCKEDGTPIHPHTFSQAFERLVARSDLPTVRLHDLRHTHATIALKAGVPVKVISERLGHESPAFTMKQYAHAMPGMQAEAATRIAEVVDRT